MTIAVVTKEVETYQKKDNKGQGERVSISVEGKAAYLYVNGYNRDSLTFLQAGQRINVKKVDKFWNIDTENTDNAQASSEPVVKPGLDSMADLLANCIKMMKDRMCGTQSISDSNWTSEDIRTAGISLFIQMSRM